MLDSQRVRPWIAASLVYAFLGLLFLYPLARLAVSAFSRDGALSFANVYAVLGHPSNARALLNSLYVGVAVTIATTIIALVLSWIVVRTDIPFKKFFQFVLIVPFFIPPFIMAFAWQRLLGRVGFFNVFLQGLFGLADPPINVFGAFGVILVSTIYTYPYAFIVVSRAIGNIGSHLEEAAQISGASKARALRDIVLPVLFPAVGSAALIVFVTTISMFGIPALLGTPGRFIVLTTRIYGYVGSFRDPHGMGIAAGLSLALLAFSLVGLLLQNYFTRKEHFTVITGKSAPLGVTRLGKLRPVITALLFVFVALVVIAPVLAIAATSVVRALGLPFVAENITFAHYQRLLDMPLVRRSLQNSMSLALVIPTIGVVIATVFVYLKRGNRMPGRNALDYIVSIPYAIPGTVIAIAMILAWIQPVLGFRIYNTIWILYIAYLVRFTIFPMRTIGASWKQLDASLEEAGRVSGASQMRTVREISLPLIRSGVASGWLLAFMPALTELTVSILLYSPRNETVGVTAFNVMQEGLVTVASAYAMIIIVVVVALNMLVRFLPAGRHASQSTSA